MDPRDNNSPKEWKDRTLVVSMESVITDIITAFKEERNMRKYTVSVILTSIAGAVSRISAIEWLFLLPAVFLVITSEIINSAIENVVDFVSNHYFSILARSAKDMAVGAVLVILDYTVLTGLVIFVPKIITLIFGEWPKLS